MLPSIIMVKMLDINRIGIGLITHLCTVLIHFCSITQYDDGGDVRHEQRDSCGDNIQLSVTCIQAHHAIHLCPVSMIN